MANRAKRFNRMNTERQAKYFAKGIIMLPTLREERKAKKEGKKA